MTNSILRAVAVAACITIPATSGAEVVSFNNGEGYFGEIRSTSPTSVAGTWVEDGFEVSWTHESDTGSFSEAVGDIAGAPFLSDCVSGGCFGTALSLSFSRPDGRDFSLESFETTMSYPSQRVETYFAPVGPGGPDSSAGGNPRLRTIYDDIRFVGTNDAGRTTVSEYASNAPGNEDSEGAGNAPAGLSDLDTLNVNVGVYDSLEEIAGKSIVGSDTAAIYERAFEACGLGTGCYLQDFGEFGFEVETGLTYNWGTALFIDDMAFSIEAGSVAAVPLPAAAPALTVGLLALGFVGRRGKRRGTPHGRTL